MQKQIRNIVRKVFYSIFPPVYFISYPKAGRTWLRLILSSIFSQVNGSKYTAEVTHQTRFSFSLPTVYFKHYSFLDLAKLESDIKKLYNKRIVLLVRDPRDVLVSSYFEHTKRRDMFEGDMESFFHDEVYGLKRIIEYYNLWYVHKDKFKAFHIIRYEDLKKKPVPQIKNLLQFLDLKINDEDNVIQQAIDYNSFERLKKRSLNTKETKLLPRDPNNPDTYKVRKGKVGGYVEYFSKENTNEATNLMQSLNKNFGYENQ